MVWREDPPSFLKPGIEDLFMSEIETQVEDERLP